jgi:hypothetical protein
LASPSGPLELRLEQEAFFAAAKKCSVAGASLPLPFGGVQRAALFAYAFSVR